MPEGIDLVITVKQVKAYQVVTQQVGHDERHHCHAQVVQQRNRT